MGTEGSDDRTANDSERAREKVWSLTEEWMNKVGAAYSLYQEMKSAVRNSMFRILLGFFVLIIVGGAGDSLSKGQDWNGLWNALGAATLIGFLLISAFDLVRRLQSLSVARVELKDLYSISRELFDMVISTEEKNSGSRYEYLVNHIRILEIKHFLRKIEREVEGFSLVVRIFR